MNNLKENLLWFRKKKKWSQEQMAAIFNVTRGMIASYERGAAPGLEMVSEICKELNVFLHEFIYEDISKMAPRLDASSVKAECEKIVSGKDQEIKTLKATLKEREMVVELQKFKLEKLESGKG